MVGASVEEASTHFRKEVPLQSPGCVVAVRLRETIAGVSPCA